MSRIVSNSPIEIVAGSKQKVVSKQALFYEAAMFLGCALSCANC